MKNIVIMPENLKIQAQEGKTILEIAQDFDLDIDGSCGGKGTCGKCRVNIDEGNGLQEVLACQFRLQRDLTIWPCRKNDRTDRKTSVRLPEDFRPDPQLLSRCAETGKPLGVAVDIGTTTVVVMLWDIAQTRLLGAEGLNNPQGVYGADVISRISFAGESPQNLKLLQDKMISAINGAVSRLVEKTGHRLQEISRFTVAGNTTMSHLFTGTDPRSLAVLPFEPVFTESRRFAASEVGLVPPDAQVNLLPNIAGHIGSDITAGMVSCGFLEEEDDSMAAGAGCKPKLYIDIGTNGEIGLINGKSLTVCSAAAGPAFEGSRVSCGMRAGTGAIERAKMTETGMEVAVIGGGAPLGVCGSGLIDIVCEMLHSGIIDKKGRLASREELRSRGLPQRICEMTGGEGREKYFTIWKSHGGGQDIRITQNDIREVQLAKGAIAAGIEILLKGEGLCAGDLEKIYIAGAFGNYIDLGKAMAIGLLPEADMGRLKSIGNAAGTGACMALLNDETIEKMEKVRKTADHVELSAQPEFLEIFSRCMRFKA